MDISSVHNIPRLNQPDARDDARFAETRARRDAPIAACAPTYHHSPTMSQRDSVDNRDDAYDAAATKIAHTQRALAAQTDEHQK